MDTFQYQRTITIIDHFDAVVLGGGPAGIAAATASGRMGAKTLLVERYGCLGGNLTVGHVGQVLGTVSRGTLADEIVERIKGAVRVGDRHRGQDMELAKRELPELLREAGCTVYLQTDLVDAITEAGAATGAILTSKAGPIGVAGKVFIDATGDGSYATAAGATFEIGRPEDGLMQPVTHEFTVAGVDEEHGLVCRGTDEAKQITIASGNYYEMCSAAVDAGLLPEHSRVVRLHRAAHNGERVVNTTQVNGINALVQEDVWRAEVELRRQIDLVVKFLRASVPGYENAYLKESASTLGVRETRRILGDYYITDDDVTSGRRFDDAVVHDVNFCMDIHNPTGSGQADGVAQAVQNYDIPYRAMLPRGVDGLLTAGRCISGSHRAHASYRVMKIAMAMGEAAGTAAALSAQVDITPRKLGHQPVQSALTKRGVVLVDLD